MDRADPTKGCPPGKNVGELNSEKTCTNLTKSVIPSHAGQRLTNGHPWPLQRRCMPLREPFAKPPCQSISASRSLHQCLPECSVCLCRLPNIGDSVRRLETEGSAAELHVIHSLLPPQAQPALQEIFLVKLELLAVALP